MLKIVPATQTAATVKYFAAMKPHLKKSKLLIQTENL